MAKSEETLLKEALNQGNVSIGTSKTVKMLKQAKIKKVFLSSNCPEAVSSEIRHYAKMADIPVVRSTRTNEDLGTFCKKPYSISVLGIK